MIEKYQEILKIIDKIILLKYKNLKPSKTKLIDITDIKYGRSLEASKLLKEGMFPVYGSNGIIGYLNTFDFDETKITISCRGASSGNVLLSKPYSTISSNSLYLNLKNIKNLAPLYSYLRQIELKNYSTGSAQPQITIENIQNLNVPNFDNISSNINKIIELSFDFTNIIEKLSKIKKLLLNKYF